MNGRDWTLTLTAPCPWLLEGDRRSPQVLARLCRRWRVTAYAAAKLGHLPTGLARVRIDGTARFRAGTPPVDAQALAPTLAAIVEGLGPCGQYLRRKVMHLSVGYGLVADIATDLDGPHITVGEPLPSRPHAPRGELVLKITEVARAELP